MCDWRKVRGHWASWGSPCTLSGVSHLPEQLTFKEKIRNPVGNESFFFKEKHTKQTKLIHGQGGAVGCGPLWQCGLQDPKE